MSVFQNVKLLSYVRLCHSDNTGHYKHFNQEHMTYDLHNFKANETLSVITNRLIFYLLFIIFKQKGPFTTLN